MLLAAPPARAAQWQRRPCPGLTASRPASGLQAPRGRAAMVVRAADKETVKKASQTPSKAPSSNGSNGASNGKKGGGNGKPLTEVDLKALQAMSPHQPPKIEWPAKRGFIEIALEQVLDAGEDIASHWKRQYRDLPTTKAFDKMRGADGDLRLEAEQPVVLVLGSGWGAHSLMKVVDVDKFAVVCVSPRNHFLFTPMLPSTAVGTVEFRSLLEPVRVANPFVDYFEATCDRIDLENKVAYCTSKNSFLDGRTPSFQIPFDILVVSVGEQPATFGTPGVEENCFFMKEVSDTQGLRQRIQNQFELASLPGTSDEDMRQSLHFVVVGGGPTGVEFAGTLSDFLREDLRRKYPELMPYVQVTLLNSAPTILGAFDEKMQNYAIDNFGKQGVEVRTGVRVTEVTKDTIVLKNGEQLKYGVCVWSAGNAPRPIVQQLAAQIPEQAEHQPGAKPSKLAVDPFLRVIGARDVLAIGDCCLMVGDRLPATAQVAGQQGAYAAHLINRGFLPLEGGMDKPPPCKPLDAAALGGAGNVYGTLGATVLSSMDGDSPLQVPLTYYKKPFAFLNLGALAYLGGDKALTEIKLPGTEIKLGGSVAYLVWKSVYITKQVSFRNRVLILFDWLKAQMFGRDLSNF